MFSKIRTILLTLSAAVSLQTVTAQQTMGLFFNDPASYNGYTIFSSLSYPDVYLIDNCGKLVHKWTCGNNQTNMVYLLENGLLLRPEHIDNFLNIAGTGGLLRLYDWDGNVAWEFEYQGEDYVQHHDVEPMPNGNILVIAYEAKDYGACIQAGRDSSKLTTGGLWPDKVVELQPVGSDSAVVVWEWHAWDHLVQDYDPAKDNYGVISDHPELIDVNFTGLASDVEHEDWMHSNSVTYNESLDQVMISLRHFSEVWIIDHSTTTGEAAGHTGGLGGKGGDLLYRWGNPQTYGRGGPDDQQFWGQHDANWIPDGYSGGGGIMVFNNGVWGPQYSTINIIDPPVDDLGNYTIGDMEAFGPAAPSWSYGDADSNFFFSPLISSASRMPNGNTLICVGLNGHFFEIGPEGNRVWDYINPVGWQGPNIQGGPLNFNATFRVARYDPDYPGFEGKELSGTDPIELDPLPYECTLYFSGDPGLSLPSDSLSIFPNPFCDQLHIRGLDRGRRMVSLYDLTGRILYQSETGRDSGLDLSLPHLEAGIYFLRVGEMAFPVVRR